MFSRLQKANFTCKAAKCHLFRRQVTYLGYIVDEDGLRPDSINVKAVKEIPRPTTLTGLRSFLGTVNFYRHFIKD